jgi:glycerol-3-phosphate dehydrogenase
MPRRGQWLVMDREFGEQVPGILTGFPTSISHGPMVIPTAHGSVLLGPTAEDIAEKDNTATDEDTLKTVLAECFILMPTIDPRAVIKTFSGVRSNADPTYRVGFSDRLRNLIHVAGIRSTGVSASPGIAEYVRDLMIDRGLALLKTANAVDRLATPLPRWASLDWGASPTDPLDCTVICACEKVTAADIHRALQGPLPARSVGGVARRTHATWGRCQGAACLSGVCFLTSLYVGGEAWEVPLDEPGSTFGVADTTHG